MTGPTQGARQAGSDSPATLPRVTVSIVLYDDGGTIEAVLDGVAALHQTRAVIEAVLVVDNQSQDDGPARAAAHKSTPTVIRRGVNDGPCGARNLGLQQSSTEWVLALDGDVVPEPQCLDQLMAQAADDVAIVMPRAVLAGDTEVVHYDGGWQHYAGIMCLPNLMARVGGLPTAPAHDVDAVVSMALLVRRAALLDAGGWDSTFFILFEDHDVSYRLRVLGWRLRFEPGARVLHHEGTAGISFRPGALAYPPRRAWLHGRNRAYLVLACYSWPAYLLTLPGRLLYDLAWFAFALRRGVALSWLGGKLSALTLVPAALARRRLLAGRRRLADRDLLGCAALTVSPVAAPAGLEARLQRILAMALALWWRAARVLLPGASPAPSRAPNGQDTPGGPSAS